MADLIAGMDEAGRGPLAGPVVAAAVILPGDLSGLEGLADSKTLAARKREALAARIRACAMVGVGVAEPSEIDAVNILQATMRAMARAIDALKLAPHRILIDGNRVPDGLPRPAEAIVGGDASEPAIAAASIIAKTLRDGLMVEAEARFPGYGFASHKGYPSAAHRDALIALGPCPLHRLSYRPVAEAQARRAAQR